MNTLRASTQLSGFLFTCFVPDAPTLLRQSRVAGSIIPGSIRHQKWIAAVCFLFTVIVVDSNGRCLFAKTRVDVRTRRLTGMGPGLYSNDPAGRDLEPVWNLTDPFLQSKPRRLARSPDQLLTLPTSSKRPGCTASQNNGPGICIAHLQSGFPPEGTCRHRDHEREMEGKG